MNPRKFTLGEGGPADFAAFLRKLAEESDDENNVRDKIRRDVLPDVLAYRYQHLCRLLTEPPQKFQVGNLVTWKDSSMATHRWPVRGEPVIVTAVLDEPIVVTIDAKHGTPYWREPLDLKLGWLSPDPDRQQFLEFFGDSRRYRLWDPEEMAEELRESQGS